MTVLTVHFFSASSHISLGLLATFFISLVGPARSSVGGTSNDIVRDTKIEQGSDFSEAGPNPVALRNETLFALSCPRLERLDGVP